MHSFVVLVVEHVVAAVVQAVASVFVGGVLAAAEGLSSVAVLSTYFSFVVLEVQSHVLSVNSFLLDRTQHHFQ